jgi:hypothetical protein
MASGVDGRSLVDGWMASEARPVGGQRRGAWWWLVEPRTARATVGRFERQPGRRLGGSGERCDDWVGGGPWLRIVMVLSPDIGL